MAAIASTRKIRTEQEIASDLRAEIGPAEMLNPNRAAWAAMRQAASFGLDATQTAGTVAEAVLRAVWDNALRGYDSKDVTHSCGGDNDGCNVCILEDIAHCLGRKHWASEIYANRAPQEG